MRILQIKVGLFALFCSLGFSFQSDAAVRFSGHVGGSLENRTPSLMIGSEAIFSFLNDLDLGGFVDVHFFDPGAFYFYGPLFRTSLRRSPLFFDLRFGLGYQSHPSEGGLDSPHAFGIGMGAGVKIPMSSQISFVPRVGYRQFFASGAAQTRGMADFALMLSIAL